MFDLLTDIHEQLLNPERFLTAIGAIVLGAILGLLTGPRYKNATPPCWQIIQTLTGWIGAKLDRPHRKAADLMFRAILLVSLSLLMAYIASLFAVRLSARIPLGGLSEILFLGMSLTVGAVWFALLKLYDALKNKKVGEGSYFVLARAARLNLVKSDDYAITRAGMSLAARSFDKGCVAPVIWYLLLGLPGAFIYAALAALAWQYGRDGKGSPFGKLILGLEKLLGFVPHIMAGVLIALAGLLTPTGGMSRALSALLYAGNKAPYAEGGLPVTAMAYVLDVSLGGAVQDIDGYALKRAWTGPSGATAQLVEGHLHRALYLILMAHLLFIFSLIGAMLFAGRLF